MRQISFVCSSVATVLLLAGCTTELETRRGLTDTELAAPLKDTTAQLDPDLGKLELLSYNVPAAQFKIAAKWRVSDCDVNGTPTDVEVQATIDTDYPAAEKFSIDYAALSNFNKITSAKIERYSNGTLKTVNAEANDRTIETATAVVKFVATASALGGAGAVTDPKCTALDARRTSEQALKVARLAVDQDIAGVIAGMNIPAGRTGAAKALEDLGKLRDTLSSRIAALQEAGWSTEEVKWPASPTKLLSLNSVDALPLPDPLSAIHISVTPMSLAPAKNFAAPSGDSFGGLVWRSGSRATIELVWCDTSTLTPLADKPLKKTGLTCPAGKDGYTLAQIQTQVPQAGPFFLIPLRNTIGRNNSIAASFGANGSIDSAGYGDKNAVGEQIATSATTLATAAGALKSDPLATKLKARKDCLDIVEGLRKSETAVSDLLDGGGSQSKYADYARQCLE